jgi:hypothetical protein
MTTLLIVFSIGFADGWSAETKDRDWPSETPAFLRPLLDSKATILSDTGEILTVWLRKELPAKATAEQIKNGLSTRELLETTLLGLIRFEKPFVDYRKQEIPAGLYSLRLGFQPDTGDHKDTAPHPDFALLVPIAEEKSADELEMKTLVVRSRKATGGDHPGVMLLSPFKPGQDEPKLQLADGFRTLSFTRPVDADGTRTRIGLALTVSGSSKTRDGK